MAHKVTFVFSAYKYGWTEILYNNLSDTGVLGFIADNFAKARAALLGSGAVLEAYKIRNLDIARYTEIEPVFEAGPDVTKAQQPIFMDSPWQGVLVHLFSDATNRRNYIVRCPPDNLIDSATNVLAWLAFDDYVAAFAETARELTDPNNGWCIYGYQRKGIKFTRKNILSITIPPAGGTPLITLDNGLAAGQTVRLKGIKGKNATRLNGVWKLAPGGAPNVFTIPVTYAAATPFGYVAGGYADPLSRDFVPITAARVQRPVRRACGRQLFTEKGKAAPKPFRIQAV